jgi:hypothetical protein
MSSFVSELGLFMRQHKKLWLIPILVTATLVGSLVMFTHDTAIAPFIYTLF